VSEEVRAAAPTSEPSPTSAPESAATGRPAEPATPADGVPTRAEAFVTGGAYGVLTVGGAVLGVAGSFYQNVTVGRVPLFAIVFALVNLGAFRLAGWAMGTRLGAVVPAAGWLLVVFLMSSRRPEGDLVVTGGAAGYVYLLGGAVAAVVAIARTPATRNWIVPR
jgi:hypothetical protein